jgi:hypothetical protein
MALAACGSKKEQAPATGSAGSAGSAAVVVADDAGAGSGSGSAQAQAEPVDVPTEVDFEELATSEITDKNVEARVKELEGELAQ